MGADLAGNLRFPVINSLPFSFKCLSKMILFIVFAKSKFTSLNKVVVSAELLPLNDFVF